MGIKERFKYCVMNEEGASNLEIIVWMAVVLVIAGFLFAFRAQISAFINTATGQVEDMDDNIKGYISKGQEEMSDLTPGGDGL